MEIRKHVMVSLLVTCLILTGFTAAYGYVCGDSNGDAEVNVADAVYTINFVFKGGPAPDPLDAGDTNRDGACNVGDAVMTISYVFRDGPPIVCEPMLFVDLSVGCKIFTPGSETDTIPENLDCVEWSYDGSAVFSISHMNTVFNCCPEELLADISIENGDIVITENEDFGVSGGCYCLCLFNFDYHIEFLPPGHYTITVIGLYLVDREPIFFEVDLTGTPSSGIECVERPSWP